MATLFMMCGVPGSGKSTLCKKLLLVHPDYVYISRDEIRYSIVKSNEPYFAKEDLVFKVYIQRIYDALSAGKDVLADATHLNYASRVKVLKKLPFDTKKVALVCKAKLSDCLERNAMRGGRERVPEKNVREMYAKFSIPTYDEGFDNIMIKET